MNTTLITKGKYTLYKINLNKLASRTEFLIHEDIVPTLIDIQGAANLSFGPALMTQENPGITPHKVQFRGAVVFNPKKAILVHGWNHPPLVTEFECAHKWSGVFPIAATKEQIWQVVEANLNDEFDELLNVMQYDVPEIRENYFISGRYDIPCVYPVYETSDLPQDHPDYREGITHKEREKRLSKEVLNLNNPEDMERFLSSAVFTSSLPQA